MAQNQIQIRAKDEDLKGTYSNIMQIIHTQEEFILDFFLVSGSAGSLSSRVILSPGHAKRMIAALQENLNKYEAKFGAVTPAEQPGSIGFQPEQQ
ncbi:MAG: DUF3467 domain-containing protein [Candidatus Yanofskybacteria bacterium]|nr:DUF3467 domain-containing protein [Candidatus Yanofskybacteria bacterium]